MSSGDNVPKVLVFTTDGDFLMAWNTTTLEMPHGIFLADGGSSNPTVWITDVGDGPYGHCIKQYSPSGKLLQVPGIYLPFQLSLIVSPAWMLYTIRNPSDVALVLNIFFYLLGGWHGREKRLWVKSSAVRQSC